MKVKLFSHVRLFATPWTVTYQAPLSMGFSRQEYWSGLPFPSSGDLPNPGIESRSPALQGDSSLSEPPGKPPVIDKKLPNCTFWSCLFCFRVSKFHLSSENISQYLHLPTHTQNQGSGVPDLCGDFDTAIPCLEAFAPRPGFPPIVGRIV